MSINRSVVLLFFLFFITPYVFAYPFPQPIGKLIEEWDPKVVNQYLAKWDPNIVPGITDPFNTHYTVTEIQPTEHMYFVRVYAEPTSGPLGSFIVRAQYIRGLTKEQIRDVLALPELPTKIVYVKVPVGDKYGLWTGVSGGIMSPDHEWGHGGVLQTKIIGKHSNGSPPADPARFEDYDRFPADSYMNAEFIPEHALSYQTNVSKGNAGNVAKYLDKIIPSPYSDLEYVYAGLDYVNFASDPNQPLSNVLLQLSPINYDAISSVLFRNEILFENILISKNDRYIPYKRFKVNNLNNDCDSPWMSVIGEQGSQTNPSYYYQTGAIMSGMDCHAQNGAMTGAAIAYLENHLGNIAGSVSNLKFGVYHRITEPNYFIGSSMTLGYDWSSFSRHIHFTGVVKAVLTGLPADYIPIYRTAFSKQSGKSFGLSFDVGYKYAFYQSLIIPNARLSYFASRISGFKEKGADDLNLKVNDINAQTLRSQLSLLVSNAFQSENKHIYTSIELGWAHNTPINHRNISASMVNTIERFTVNGDDKDTNGFLMNAGISAQIDKRLWLDGNYYGDLSHGFNAQTFALTAKYFFDA